MRTGKNGRVAISWTQTEIDGLEAAPLAFLIVGAAWSWRGQASALSDAAEMNMGKVESAGLVGAHPGANAFPACEVPGSAHKSVVLTNGAQQFTATLFAAEDEVVPTLVFEGGYPERDQEFWISEIQDVAPQSGVTTENGNTVIRFPAQPQTPMPRSNSNPRFAANSQWALD